MKNFRGKLTRLQNLIREQLPDEPDIYGFPGVDKDMLISGLEVVYKLSYEIPDSSSHYAFEIVMLKRYGDWAYEAAKGLLTEGVFRKRKQRSKFNELLNVLGELTARTKVTYFIVAQEGLRSDEELAELKHEASKLVEQKRVLNDQAEALNPVFENARNLAEELESARTSGVEARDLVVTAQESVESAAALASERASKVETYFAEIEGRREAFSILKKEVQELEVSASTLASDLEAQLQSVSESAEALEQLEARNASLVEEASKTLGDANRVGMAASFKERKSELGRQLVVWQAVFVLATSGIAFLSWSLLLPEIGVKGVDWPFVTSRIAIIAPIVWLAWFAARQYGSTAKIREDYAFKYAAAMAYEGHKKATREVNEELEAFLLETSLANMAENPIRLYSKRQESATPVQAALRSLVDRVPWSSSEDEHEEDSVKRAANTRPETDG